MDDDEAIQLAAKAAGIGPIHFNGLYWYRKAHGEFQPPEWNPITRNDDAFSLMVKLNIRVLRWLHATQVDTEHLTVGILDVDRARHADYSPEECTRRAIVMAAAEIEKRSRKPHHQKTNDQK